ncbi:MAG: dihydropyrimidinase [Halarsenatibacteraceae bacterium]
MKRLISGGKVVLETGVEERNIIIEGNKIKKIIAPDADKPTGEYDVIDATGKIVLPGVIDAHTHYLLHSRGTTTADDFKTGSISAAHGGVTTFIDFSDHQENKSLLESAKERIDEGEAEAVIDFHLHQTVESFDDKIAEELAEIKDFGITNLKIFTTYKKEGYMIEDEKLPELFQRAKELDLLVIAHCEDENIIQEKLKDYKAVKDEIKFSDHPDLRPGEGEGKAIENLSKIALEKDQPLYIVHISSKEGIQALRKARQEGVKIYGETTPHYLLLDRSYLEREDSEKYFMVPPLREVEDHQEIWDAIINKEIQVVATDHCAFNLEQKKLTSSPINALPGIPGSETLLPLLHHFGVNRGLINYEELVAFLSTEPAKIFGLYPDRGVIKEGSIADLVIFDPDKEIELTDDQLHSAADYSPYSDFTVVGYPVETISKGETIIKDGIFTSDAGRGKFIKAKSSSVFQS